MALNDFFAGEIAAELLKMLMSISRKSLLCRTSAEQLITYIQELLPTIQEIKFSGVQLPEQRQFRLDRLSEILRSGVELSHKVLSSSRWNVYKNLQLAKKMEKLEKNVSRFLQGPMQAHILADVHHTRFEMAERFDRVEASIRRLEQYFGAMKIGRRFTTGAAAASSGSVPLEDDPLTALTLAPPGTGDGVEEEVSVTREKEVSPERVPPVVFWDAMRHVIAREVREYMSNSAYSDNLGSN